LLASLLLGCLVSQQVKDRPARGRPSMSSIKSTLNQVKRFLLPGLGLLLLVLTLRAVYVRMSAWDALPVQGERESIIEFQARMNDPKLRERRDQFQSTAFNACLQMWVALGLVALAVSWQMGFSFGRIGRCLYAVMLGGGVVAALCFPVWLMSVFAG